MSLQKKAQRCRFLVSTIKFMKKESMCADGVATHCTNLKVSSTLDADCVNSLALTFIPEGQPLPPVADEI